MIALTSLYSESMTLALPFLDVIFCSGIILYTLFFYKYSISTSDTLQPDILETFP